MKRIKQQNQSHRLLLCAINLFLVLLVIFVAARASAQQSAPAVQATANPATVQTPANVAGAPAMGFRAPAPAPAADKPAVQPVASARPVIDPRTGAPFSSTLPTRAISVDGATNEEESNDLGMLASDGSLHQGLRVHGHWVINVSNPDGSQVQHHEFENSLEPSAGGTLAGLLGGQFSMGNMMIALGYSSANGPCQGNVTNSGWCAMVTGLSTQPALTYCGAYVCASTLTETFNSGTNYNGPFNFVLSGTITANAAGTINTVYTIYSTCANIAFGGNGPSTASTVSPATCAAEGASYANPWPGPLTGATITGVPIASGQVVQVIVTLTFS